MNLNLFVRYIIREAAGHNAVGTELLKRLVLHKLTHVQVHHLLHGVKLPALLLLRRSEVPIGVDLWLGPLALLELGLLDLGVHLHELVVVVHRLLPEARVHVRHRRVLQLVLVDALHVG